MVVVLKLMDKYHHNFHHILCAPGSSFSSLFSSKIMQKVNLVGFVCSCEIAKAVPL
jgi:hypothetical protein